MTSIPSREGSRSEELLRNARRHYAEITDALEMALQRINQSDDKEMRAFSSAVQAHWRSYLNVHEREVELEKRDRERSGIVESYAIDLGAARAEVGRRLARLRDAGNA